MKLPPPIQEFIYEPPVTQHLWPRHVMHIVVGSAIPVGVLLLPLDLAKWLLIVFSVVAIVLEVGRASLPTPWTRWSAVLRIREGPRVPRRSWLLRESSPA